MKKRLAVLLAALVLAFSGCSSEKKGEGSSTKTDNSDEGDTRQSGSTISLYMRPPTTFNPLVNSDESVDMVLRLVYEPLIAIDESFKPTDSIAESWYFSNEGKTITVKLKDGLKWHSGNPITANDVVYSVNTIKYADESSMYKACVRYISDAAAVDSLTVNINFTRAFYGNIYALTFPLISSQNGSSQNVYEASSSMNKLGNGSFDFGSYSASKQLELVKAESCVGKEAVAESINVVISKDSDTDLYYFTTGVTDCIYASASQLVGRNMPARASEYNYDTEEYDFLGFNFNNSVLKDKNVRKAVAYSMPKEELLKTVYLSNAKLTDSPIHPESWLYENETVKYDYNLAEAKKVLDEAGWVLNDGESVRSKDGENGKTKLSLRILVNTENEQRRQIAKSMADELMSIGFEIKVEEVSFSQYSNKIASRDYDIVIGGWNLSMDNDLNELFGSGKNNILGYNDEKMNEYIADIYNAVGESSVKEAYGNAQKYISEELPYISIAFKTGKFYSGSDIMGGGEIFFNSIFNGVYGWYKR